jgi:hypothetical protein
VSRAAGLLAIALLGILVMRVYDRRLAAELTALRLAPDAVAAMEAERGRLTAADAPRGVSQADHHAIRRAVATSFVSGFRSMALVAAALAVASALAAAALIAGAPRPVPRQA